jgi:hypothetical protein
MCRRRLHLIRSFVGPTRNDIDLATRPPELLAPETGILRGNPKAVLVPNTGHRLVGWQLLDMAWPEDCGAGRPSRTIP